LARERLNAHLDQRNTVGSPRPANAAGGMQPQANVQQQVIIIKRKKFKKIYF
jgi:hypothetical protein